MHNCAAHRSRRFPECTGLARPVTSAAADSALHLLTRSKTKWSGRWESNPHGLAGQRYCNFERGSGRLCSRWGRGEVIGMNLDAAADAGGDERGMQALPGAKPGEQSGDEVLVEGAD